MSSEVSFTMLVCLACPLFIDSTREKINTSRVAISNMSKISEVQITKFHSNAQRGPVSPELLRQRENVYSLLH